MSQGGAWRLGSLGIASPFVTHTCPSVLTRSGQLDKLVISQLGLLAQRRLARGVKLNHAEATVGADGPVDATCR